MAGRQRKESLENQYCPPTFPPAHGVVTQADICSIHCVATINNQPEISVNTSPLYNDNVLVYTSDGIEQVSTGAGSRQALVASIS